MDPGRRRRELATQTPRLRGYLRVLSGDAATAEDLLSEVVLRFLDPAHEVEERGARSWLFTTARHVALNHLRGEKRRAARERTAGTGRDAAMQDPHDVTARREDLERLFACLQRLALPLREMLYLKVAEGYTLRDVAAATGVPRSTVSLRIQEALIALNRCVGGETS